MEWIEHFHKDHMEVLLLLTKLEGNLLEVRHLGKLRSGIILECKEFLEVVDKVIKPHFKLEEDKLYPEVAAKGEQAKLFIDLMLADHQKLYTAFNEFNGAVYCENPADLVTAGDNILAVLKNHIEKEELDIPAIMGGKSTK